MTKRRPFKTMDGDKMLLSFLHSYGLLPASEADKLGTGPYRLAGWRDGFYTHHLLRDSQGHVWHLMRPRNDETVLLFPSVLNVWHPVLQARL